MALSEPRSTATVDVELTGSAIRLRALELAVQRYEGTVDADKIVTFAKTLEQYLTGPRDTSPVDARPVASGSAPLEVNPEEEAWRMGVERLPYDGEDKTLDGLDLAYRIEVLANIVLVDVNEDPGTRSNALLELTRSVNRLDAQTTYDSAE